MFKKILLIVFVALLGVSCSEDDTPTQLPEQELKVKSVEFQVFTDQSFSEGRFDEAYVKPTLVLLKEDSKGNHITLFEKTYDWIHFRDFPKETNKLVEQHTVTYDEKSEVVFVSYGLSFRVNGMLSAEGTSYTLPAGEDSHLVVVKL